MSLDKDTCKTALDTKELLANTSSVKSDHPESTAKTVAGMTEGQNVLEDSCIWQKKTTKTTHKKTQLIHSNPATLT